MKKGKLKKDDVLIVKDGATTGKVGFFGSSSPFEGGAVNEHVFILRVKDKTKILPFYLYKIVKSSHGKNEILRFKVDGGIGGINLSIKKSKIPLPPLEIQEQIVAELENYQKIIDGARQVVENYKPTFKIDPNWELVALNKVCYKITDGTHITPKYTDEGVPFLRVTDLTETNDLKKYISYSEHKNLIKRCKPEKGDILYSKNGTIGIAKLINWDWEFSIFVSLALLKPNRNIIYPEYLEIFLNSKEALKQANAHSKSGTVTNLHLVEIKQIKIPIPPLETQNTIIKRIMEEQKIIDANKELIKIYEQKIKDKIAEVWGE